MSKVGKRIERVTAESPAPWPGAGQSKSQLQVADKSGAYRYRKHLQSLTTMTSGMNDYFRNSELTTVEHLNNIYRHMETLKQKTIDVTQQVGKYPEYFAHFTGWTEKLVQDFQKLYGQLRGDCEKESILVHGHMGILQSDMENLEKQIVQSMELWNKLTHGLSQEQLSNGATSSHEKDHMSKDISRLYEEMQNMESAFRQHMEDQMNHMALFARKSD